MRSISGGLKDICNMGSVRCSTVYPEKFGISPLWGTSTSDDDMCIIDDKDDFSVGASAQPKFSMLDDFSKVILLKFLLWNEPIYVPKCSKFTNSLWIN